MKSRPVKVSLTNDEAEKLKQYMKDTKLNLQQTLEFLAMQALLSEIDRPEKIVKEAQFRLSSTTHKRLKEKSEKIGISMSDMIAQMLNKAA